MSRTSLALSCLALFIALGGGAYAAITLPKNSVTTKQVKDHSLLGRDFRRGQLPRGARGPEGQPGTPGSQGPQGAQGPAGIANITSVQSTPGFQCASGGGACQVASVTATCPAGSVVVGGGFLTDVPDDIVGFAERTGATTFGVIATNEWSTSGSVRAQAICASGPGAAASAASSSPLAMRRLAKKLRAALRR